MIRKNPRYPHFPVINANRGEIIAENTISKDITLAIINIYIKQSKTNIKQLLAFLLVLKKIVIYYNIDINNSNMYGSF